MIHNVRRAGLSALPLGALAAALAGCDSTTLTSSSDDRIAPTVTLAVDGIQNTPSQVDS